MRSLQSLEYKSLPLPDSKDKENEDQILTPPIGTAAKANLDFFINAIKQSDSDSLYSRSLNNATPGKPVEDYFTKITKNLYPEQDIKKDVQVEFITTLRQRGTVLAKKPDAKDESPFVENTFTLQPWVEYFQFESPFDEKGNLKSWAKTPFPEKNHSAINESLQKILQWSNDAIYDIKDQPRSWVKKFYTDELLEIAERKIGKSALRSHLTGAVSQALSGQYINNKSSLPVFASTLGCILDRHYKVITQCVAQLSLIRSQLIKLSEKDPRYRITLKTLTAGEKLFATYLKNPSNAGKIPALTEILYITNAAIKDPTNPKIQAQLEKLTKDPNASSNHYTWSQLIGGAAALLGVSVITLSGFGIPATIGFSNGWSFIGGGLLTLSGLSIFNSVDESKPNINELREQKQKISPKLQ